MLKSQKKHYWVAILNSAVAVAVVTGVVAVVQTAMQTERTSEESIEDWSVLRSHNLFFTLRERRIIRDAYQCSSGDNLSTRLARTISTIADGTIVDMFVEMINDMETRPVVGELWRAHALQVLGGRIARYNQLVQEIPTLPSEVLRWFMGSRTQASLRRSRAIEDIPVVGRSSYELTEIWLNWFTRLYRERIIYPSAWWCANIDSAMVGGTPIP